VPRPGTLFLWGSEPSESNGFLPVDITPHAAIFVTRLDLEPYALIDNKCSLFRELLTAFVLRPIPCHRSQTEACLTAGNHLGHREVAIFVCDSGSWRMREQGYTNFRYLSSKGADVRHLIAERLGILLKIFGRRPCERRSCQGQGTQSTLPRAPLHAAISRLDLKPYTLVDNECSLSRELLAAFALRPIPCHRGQTEACLTLESTFHTWRGFTIS